MHWLFQYGVLRGFNYLLYYVVGFFFTFLRILLDETQTRISSADLASGGTSSKVKSFWSAPLNINIFQERSGPEMPLCITIF